MLHPSTGRQGQILEHRESARPAPPIRVPSNPVAALPRQMCVPRRLAREDGAAQRAHRLSGCPAHTALFLVPFEIAL